MEYDKSKDIAYSYRTFNKVIYFFIIYMCSFSMFSDVLCQFTNIIYFNYVFNMITTYCKCITC